MFIFYNQPNCKNTDNATMIENQIPLKSVLGTVYSPANYNVVEESHLNRDFNFCSFMCSSFQRTHFIDFVCLRRSCKKFCHWIQITLVLRFIKHILLTNLQSIAPLLKHIFVTFLPSREKQINSLLLVSVGDTDK